MTHLRRRLLSLACGLAVGCGPTAPPTLDEAGEKEYERQQQEANAAEGKKPKGPQPEN